MNLKIALLQLTTHGTDLAANLAKGEAFCRRAAAMGADVALFPEMWNIGYTPCPSDADGRTAWHALALTQQSEYVTHFRDLARELDMAIALTYLERRGEAVRNSVSLIDRHGDILFTYSKVHTCEFDWEAECEPGEDFYVAPLDTKSGPVKERDRIAHDLAATFQVRERNRQVEFARQFAEVGDVLALLRERERAPGCAAFCVRRAMRVANVPHLWKQRHVRALRPRATAKVFAFGLIGGEVSGVGGHLE